MSALCIGRLGARRLRPRDSSVPSSVRSSLSGQSIHGMSASFGNMAIIGLPIAIDVFGTAATLPVYHCCRRCNYPDVNHYCHLGGY